MFDWWRRWRLTRWTRILYARERRLAAFESSPFETPFSTQTDIQSRYRNSISKARYRVDLLGHCELPKAKVRR